jgi:hypothetical protein
VALLSGFTYFTETIYSVLFKENYLEDYTVISGVMAGAFL